MQKPAEAGSGGVMSWIALAIKPFVAFVFFGLILLPVRYAVIRFMPDGKLKRVLLMRVD
jgi:hypothetical protein